MKKLIETDLRAPGSYHLKNIHILSPEHSILNGSLILEKGEIKYFGESDNRPADLGGVDIDASSWLVTPGLTNAHTHVAMGFLRDLTHGHENMIGDIFFPTESQLTADMIELLSLSGLIAGIKSGVTCFYEHYYFVESIGRAIEKLGVRGCLAETIADLGGAFPGREGFERTKKLIEQWPFSEKVTPVLGPHASDTLSPELLAEIADFQKSLGLGVHMHLAQTQREFDLVKKAHGKTPVEFMDQLGLLGEKTLAVHCIANTSKDFKILEDRGVSVGVCASSEVFYEKLIDLKQILLKDLNFYIGTDCAASHDSMDLIRELFVTSLLFEKEKLSLEPQEVLKSIFAPKKFLSSGNQGYFADNDLVFYHWGLEVEPINDLAPWYINSLGSRHVKHVLCDKNFVLYGGNVQGLDESSFREEIQKTSSQLISKIKS